MKIVIYIALIVIGISSAFPVFAQSPSATPSGSLNKELDKIKEKVAERVEALSKNEKAVAGKIKAMGPQEWDLELPEGTQARVSVDDTLTRFYDIVGTLTKELKKDQYKVGDYVFVTGPEIDEVVTANAIYRDQVYLVFSGKITEVNATDFSINVLSVDKSTYTLDVETKTATRMFNIKTKALDKIGFSKLKEGDSVHVVVKSNPQKPTQDRFSADRIAVIPNEYFMQ